MFNIRVEGKDTVISLKLYVKQSKVSRNGWMINGNTHDGCVSRCPATSADSEAGNPKLENGFEIRAFNELGFWEFEPTQVEGF